MISQENAMNNSQKGINGNIMDESLISVISIDKKDIIIEQEGSIFQLTKTENQNSDKNKSLIILKIDDFDEGLLILKIEYEILNTFKKLYLILSAKSKVSIDVV